MTAFRSYSQAAQDRFVHAVLDGKRDGFFLDVGCCHPTEISNTYALEQLGWTGVLIDNDPGAASLCRADRRGRVIEGDATMIDWSLKLPPVVDYLSLDIDSGTLDALRNILSTDVRFRVITIEHDSYRFGPGPRDEMRRILWAHGYELVCEDVQSTDMQPFEDWWVTPELSERADRFRCVGKKWTEIFPT